MLTVQLLLVLLFSTHAAIGDEEAGEVLELNPNDFPGALQRFPALLVQFYAPWCPHCQELAPKYAEVAKSLSSSPAAVKLAQLDGDHFGEFVRQQQQPVIEGYPTLVLYRAGGLIRDEYRGPHEVASIVHWLSRKVRPRRQAVPDAVLELTSQNFEDAITDYPFLMVQFYAPWCPYCQELAPVYTAMARNLAKHNSRIKLARLDATKDRSLAEFYGAKRYPTLVFFRHGVPTIYEGSRDQLGMVRWMEEKIAARNEQRQLDARFRTGEDGGQQVVVATTTGTSRRLVPVMVNLVSMVVVSTVLG